MTDITKDWVDTNIQCPACDRTFWTVTKQPDHREVWCGNGRCNAAGDVPNSGVRLVGEETVEQAAARLVKRIIAEMDRRGEQP